MELFNFMAWFGIIGAEIGMCLLVAKILTYPMKTVIYVDRKGKTRKKRVEDTSYHYKPQEIWEPPQHWLDWKKTYVEWCAENELKKENTTK